MVRTAPWLVAILLSAAAIFIVLGVVIAFADEGNGLALLIGIVLAGVMVYGLVALAPLGFVMEVGAHGLRFHGGPWRWSVDLPWEAVEAVGLVPDGPRRVIAVRPVRGLSNPPRRARLRWIRGTRTLAVAGLERWAMHPTELIELLQTHAGDKWLDDMGVEWR